MIRFKINTVPIAQPRQRHRIARDKAGEPFVRNFTPTDSPVNAYKAALQRAASEAYQGPPLEGPLALSVLFVLPRPGRLIWKKRPMPREPHEVKPDVDNLLKSSIDALTGLLWRDDTQIHRLVAVKCYAAGDEAPHVELQVTEGARLAVPLMPEESEPLFAEV